jgi:hypothetical protein
VPTSRIDTEHCRVVATGRARGSGGRGGEQQHPHHAFYYTGPAAGANSAVPSPPQQPSSFVGTLTIIPPPAADQAPPSADKKALAKVDERRIRMPTLCRVAVARRSSRGNTVDSSMSCCGGCSPRRPSCLPRREDQRAGALVGRGDHRVAAPTAPSGCYLCPRPRSRRDRPSSPCGPRAARAGAAAVMSRAPIYPTAGGSGNQRQR